MGVAYRIVYYEPDPFVGTRYALGALVWRGVVRTWVPCKHLPAAGCPLIGAKAAVTIESVARRLSAGESPHEVSPYVVTDHVQRMPDGVDAIEWLGKMLNGEQT